MTTSQPFGTSAVGLTIHELTEAYRRGETTPTAVAEAYLARIATLDHEVGAYLAVTGEQALEAAGAADAQYRAGTPRSRSRSTRRSAIP